MEGSYNLLVRGFLRTGQADGFAPAITQSTVPVADNLDMCVLPQSR